jgi:hypothetical protein
MSAINFKNGDEVQISDESGFRYQGIDEDGEKMRGVISPNSNGWYTVTWDNGDTNSYQDNDLEPYGATKSSHSFELNERVIVCEDGFGFGKSEVGKEFIIVEFGDYGGDLGVKLRDAETNTIHPNSHFNDFVGIKSIKKMESQTEPQCKFKVGDEVVGNSKATDRYCVTQTGWRGKVTKVNSDFFMAEGRGNTGDIAKFDLQYECFDLAQSEPSEPQRKFKVGDKVTYKYQKDLLGSCYRYGGPCQGGYVGTIKSIEHDDSLNVTTESGLVYHMSPDEFVEYDGVAIKPIDIEALLEEANRRYPIGTMYKELNDEGKATGALREADQKADWVVHGQSIEVGYGYVYAKGRWAEVVNETKVEPTEKPDKQQLLEEARRRYPVGCRYRPIDGKGRAYDDTYISSYVCEWRDNGIDCGIGYVYVNGLWADVVPETKYVVTQRIPSTKQLPDTQAPIIMSRSKSKNKIKVL